jgi:transporter family protein
MILESWKFWAILSAVFASLTAVFGKIGVTQINSNLATFYRTIVVSFLLFIFLNMKNISFRPLLSDSRNLFYLTISALCTGGSWVCYYRALQLGPVSKVAGVDKLSVVFTIIIACLFMNEDLTLKVFVGTVCILVGSLLLIS